MVIRAAGEDVGLFGVERHATHIIAAHKHQVRTKLSQKVFFSKGWDVPVPGQGRLARKRARRPYRPGLDGAVVAAAGELCPIVVPRH